MAPGRKTGGRKKGTPNKDIGVLREDLHNFLFNNSGKLEKWLAEVASENPEKAIDLFLKATEYALPKLARTDHTSGGKPLEAPQITIVKPE